VRTIRAMSMQKAKGTRQKDLGTDEGRGLHAEVAPYLCYLRYLRYLRP
jgi:hypothetical protein